MTNSKLTENDVVTSATSPTTPRDDINPDGIPAELKDKPRWVGWYKRVWSDDATFVSCRTGAAVTLVDEAEFVSFGEALAAYREGRVSGLAFAASTCHPDGDPDHVYTVIDLAPYRLKRHKQFVERFFSYAEDATQPEGETRARVIARSYLGEMGAKRLSDGSTCTSGPQFIVLSGRRLPSAFNSILDRHETLVEVFEKGACKLPPLRKTAPPPAVPLLATLKWNEAETPEAVEPPAASADCFDPEDSPEGEMGVEAGRIAGRRWATNANPDQLRRLYERFADWDAAFFTDGHYLDAYTVAERLFFVLNPEDDGDRKASRGFWSWWTEIACPDASFVEGFAEGVLEAMKPNAVS